MRRAAPCGAPPAAGWEGVTVESSPAAGRHDTAPEWQHGAAPAAGNERHSAAPEQCEASFAVGVNSAERGLRCGGAGGSSPLFCSMCCERPDVRGRPSAIYRRPKQGNSCAQSGRCVPIRKRIEVSLRPSPYLAYGNTRTHNRVKNHVSEIKNRRFFRATRDSAVSAVTAIMDETVIPQLLTSHENLSSENHL